MHNTIKNPSFFRPGNRKEEELIYIFNRSEHLPLLIDCVGITNPMPDYFIERSGSSLFVFEQILSGEGTLIYNGTEHRLKAGDFYCLEPYSDHIYRSSPSNPMKKIWINFYCDLFIDIFKALQLSGRGVFHSFDAADKMSTIYALAKQNPDNEILAYPVMNLLFEIVSSISRKISECGNSAGTTETAKKVKMFLDNSLSQKVSLDDLSKKFFSSKAQINREFLTAYHVSPYHYLLERRLELAKFLLINTQTSVKEIAFSLSFSDEHYFSRLFKEKTGTTPKEFRKKQVIPLFR